MQDEKTIPVSHLAAFSSLCDLFVLLVACKFSMRGLVSSLEHTPLARRHPKLLPACLLASGTSPGLDSADIESTAAALITACSENTLPVHAQRSCFVALVKVCLWPTQLGSELPVLHSMLLDSVPRLPAEVAIPVASDLLGRIRGGADGVRGFRRNASALLDQCMLTAGAVDVLAQRVLGGVPEEHLMQAASMLASTLANTSRQWGPAACTRASEELLGLMRVSAPRSAPASARAAAGQLQMGSTMALLVLWNSATRLPSANSRVFPGCGGQLCHSVLLRLTMPWLQWGQQCMLLEEGVLPRDCEQPPQLDIILCSELLHRVLGSGVAQPAALGSLQEAAVCMLASLPALKAAGSSAHQSCSEILTNFLRGAPESQVVSCVFRAMCLAPPPGGTVAPQYSVSAEMKQPGGLHLIGSKRMLSIEEHLQLSEYVSREVARLLQRSVKGGGGNQHLAAAVFNRMLREYAQIRREISAQLQQNPSADMATLFADEAGVVGDTGSGMFMAERAPPRSGSGAGASTTDQVEILNRRRVALLLSALTCMTAEAGSCILRSAGSCLQSIGLLLSACTGAADAANEADTELVSVCLSLLTAMVMGRVALSGGGDVRELKALLPVLQGVADGDMAHLSDMASALCMGILTYRDESTQSEDGDPLQELRGRLHTCSVMALDKEPAFRGGALVDAAHALASATAVAGHADILKQSIRLGLSLLNDEDSFVYTASIQLLVQCAGIDAQLLGGSLMRALREKDRSAAYTLKLLESWKAVLPKMGQVLVPFAGLLLQHTLSRAASPVPRHCDQELDIRAAYLSISGEICMQLSALGVRGEQAAMAQLEGACGVACGVVLHPPAFPSPAAAARNKQGLVLMQNAAAYCLYCLVQCLSADSLGRVLHLHTAAKLSSALRDAASAASRKHGLKVAEGHLLFAEQALKTVVQRSLNPAMSSKPAVQIGLRGSSILNR
mgnify:CR=1 FL=1